jgi:hypothetical protein
MPLKLKKIPGYYPQDMVENVSLLGFALRRALHYSQLPTVYCEAKRHSILIFLCAPAGVISCRFIVVLLCQCL